MKNTGISPSTMAPHPTGRAGAGGSHDSKLRCAGPDDRCDAHRLLQSAVRRRSRGPHDRRRGRVRANPRRVLRGASRLGVRARVRRDRRATAGLRRRGARGRAGGPAAARAALVVVPLPQDDPRARGGGLSGDRDGSPRHGSVRQADRHRGLHLPRSLRPARRLRRAARADRHPPVRAGLGQPDRLALRGAQPRQVRRDRSGQRDLAGDSRGAGAVRRARESRRAQRRTRILVRRHPRPADLLLRRLRSVAPGR